jgi:oxygen-dependent protoporphyrinogen oxidase
MGIPADAEAVRGIAALADRDHDSGQPLLRADEDTTVGALARARMGDEVVDRLVEPLLGGVYAGRADDLSVQATMPGLHRAAQVEHTLTAAVRRSIDAAARPQGAPVFASVHGGLSRLVSTVAGASRARVELGTTVRGLRRHGEGWRLTVGPTVTPSTLEADAVVLAAPSAPSARLLSDVDAELAAAVGALEYASVALVTLVLPAAARMPSLSGFLAPAGQGSAVRAATFVTTKWPHLSSDTVVVRVSLGRRGESEVLRHTDAGLIALVREELPRLAGIDLPDPLAARVNRWGGALPQYGVGHVARTARVRAALPATLALAGAAFDGVGIAACVRSGRNAAELIWARLAD